MSLSRLTSRRLSRATLRLSPVVVHPNPLLLALVAPPASLSFPTQWRSPARSFITSSSSSSVPYPSVIKRPMNYGICIVPQTSAWVIERFGKFSRILSPGLHFLIPLVDRIAYIHSLKEQAIPISNQQAITMDNVTVGDEHSTYTRSSEPCPSPPPLIPSRCPVPCTPPYCVVCVRSTSTACCICA